MTSPMTGPPIHHGPHRGTTQRLAGQSRCTARPPSVTCDERDRGLRQKLHTLLQDKVPMEMLTAGEHLASESKPDFRSLRSLLLVALTSLTIPCHVF